MNDAIVTCSGCRAESDIKASAYPSGPGGIRFCPVCGFLLEPHNLRHRPTAFTVSIDDVIKELHECSAKLGSAKAERDLLSRLVDTLLKHEDPQKGEGDDD